MGWLRGGHAHGGTYLDMRSRLSAITARVMRAAVIDGVKRKPASDPEQEDELRRILYGFSAAVGPFAKERGLEVNSKSDGCERYGRGRVS